MKQKKICLLWHNLGSGNLGVQALTIGNLSILSKIGEKSNTQFSIDIVGNPEQINASDIIKICNAFKSIKIDKLNKFEISKYEFFQNAIFKRKQFLNYFSKYDFIIDVGEGDSFSDLYGRSRFFQHMISKSLAIYKSKLILAPQTIGPYVKATHRFIASILLKKSTLVFVRDKESQILTSEMGSNAILTTDVAFALPYTQQEKNEVIGINISGLLWNLKQNNRTFIKLKEDYRVLMVGIINHLISKGHIIELVPHVLSEDVLDDDQSACQEVKKIFENNNVKICPNLNDAISMKSHISGYKIFIAARMHAAIAALSAGVPVVPMAYSKKFKPLFDQIGYTNIFDCRYQNMDDCISQISNLLDGMRGNIIDFKKIESNINNTLEIYQNKLSECLNEN